MLNIVCIWLHTYIPFTTNYFLKTNICYFFMEMFRFLNETFRAITIEINYATLTIFELCIATYLREDNREMLSSSILKNFLKLLISITDMIITR